MMKEHELTHIVNIKCGVKQGHEPRNATKKSCRHNLRGQIM